MAIDVHVDDATGICLSEEELDLKASIQKFYKIKEKDTTKPFKVLGILFTRDTHEAHSNYLNLSTLTLCFKYTTWLTAILW